MQTVGRRDESTRNKFLESLTHTAMLWTIFPEAAFIPKECQVKVPLHLQTKSCNAKLHTLLDSGATDNFISPLIINRFKIKTHKLPKPKIVHNVDGSRNSIGPMTKAVTLDMHYYNQKVPLYFYVMNLGSDSMLLGMPFLAAYNPEINWQEGTFYGDVMAFTDDTHQWSHNEEIPYDPERDDPDDEDNEEFIPSNERDIIQVNKTTTATEIAAQATDQSACTWQEQVPTVDHQFGKVFSNIESTRFPDSRP